MLVLSRKVNEEIVIGDNVKITVLQIKGNSIRLGIDAPSDVRIVRGELPPISESSRDEPVKIEKPVVEPQMAEVTVVFNDDREEAGNSVEVVPFTSARAVPGRSKVASRGPRATGVDDSDQPASISFQQRLPENLTRNRLQEIVNELTRK